MVDILEAARLAATKPIDSFLEFVRRARSGEKSGVPEPVKFPTLSITQWEELGKWLDAKCPDKLPPFGMDGLAVRDAQIRRQVADWILGERPAVEDRKL